MQNKPFIVLVGVALVCAAAGCGKNSEEAAREKQRLELEEQAQRDVKKANKAITEMTDRAFRKRTPEEEEKAKAEKAKRVQELIDAQKKADAEASKNTPPAQPTP
jgi:ribulose kinase